MSFLKVHTAQNVLLEFPVGNIGQRLLAAILDLITAGLYIWVAQFAFAILLGIDLFQNDPGIVFFLIIILPVILYLPVSEYLWKGRTVGKYILKLKVVRADGSTPSLGDYVLRWLIRTIDVKLGFLGIFFIPRTPSSSAEQIFMTWVIILMILPLPIVGILSMAFSKTCQRLGDRIANTVVVINKRPFSLDDTILKTTEADYQPRFLNALDLSDKDIYIIKNVLDDLEKTGDYKHVRELGDKARQILKIEEDIKPLILLQTLVKDYNYLAKKKDLKN